MEFRTKVSPLPGRKGSVRHGCPLLLIGSCFTDNIGACLRDELFEVCVNPFGAVYNPLSIRRCVEALCTDRMVESEELFESEGVFHSFLFHSRFSGTDREAMAADLSERIAVAGEWLRRASTVIITLATTWVFFEKQSGEAVANCHKLPSAMFEQRCLSLEETVDALADIVGMIRGVNPEAKVVFTVSPLRYLNLGAHGNQLAKATLLLAVDRITERFGKEATDYFPAYEVMMDDLRDYRFYAADMKHPSQQAVDYIYQLFSETYFSETTMAVASEARRLTRRLSHAVTTPSLLLAEREKRARLEAAEALCSRFPELNTACKRYLSTLVNNGI